MNDQTRTHSSDAMEKMIGNMTAENIDGQYVPLGFPQPTPPDPLNWGQPYAHQFNTGVDQYPPQTFNFMPHVYEPNGFKKSFNNIPEMDMYNSMQHNGAPDIGLFERDYNNYIPNMPHVLNNIPDQPILHPQETVRKNTNHTQLIDHLVGNWVVPNNSGTYSPFGSSESYKPNVFELQSELTNANVIHQLSDDSKYRNEHVSEEVQFQFNRDTRKPRIVAEVKPMRPSYSDVLTKPVPQNSVKPMKADTKETKVKRDGKKNVKNDKNQKACGNSNRCNTNNDIKDLPTEKITLQAKSEKNKCNGKGSQLNRKWASLDNIADPQAKLDESKKKKSEDNKTCSKNNSKKLNKTVSDIIDSESDAVKNESFSVTKNGVKKITKPSFRPKSNDSFGSSDRPPGKRNQRTRKRETHVPFGVYGQKLKHFTKGWWKICTGFLLWLFHLISDIVLLSLNISRDMAAMSLCWVHSQWSTFVESTFGLLRRVRFFKWLGGKLASRKRPDRAPPADEGPRFAHPGLQNNICMPTTGDEAMKRLLACKGKDPYSILGVSPGCTDDDIKRYYKRQAFLVHPDKNNQPGAEEAFKILVHAFDMIGEPERRASYDRGVVESAQVAQAWSELTELLQQLQQKVESAANTIRCSSCSLRHKRVKIDRPSFAARNCNTCKIHHAAREGDIWAEAKVMGFLWHYYACMEGAVYDITEWAGCQKESLKHLRPDSHHVQYRIALGKQNQPRRHAAPTQAERPDLENLLNTLYGQGDGPPSTRRRNKKNK